MAHLLAALLLPDAICEELSSLEADLPEAQWVEPSDMIIPLHIMSRGVFEKASEEIVNALEEVKGRPYCLQLRLIHWRKQGKARGNLTIRVAENSAHEGLLRRVQKAASPYAPAHKKISARPQLVLAHVGQVPDARLAEYLQSYSQYQSASFLVDCFYLLRLAQKSGEKSDVLARFPLGERESEKEKQPMQLPSYWRRAWLKGK